MQSNIALPYFLAFEFLSMLPLEGSLALVHGNIQHLLQEYEISLWVLRTYANIVVATLDKTVHKNQEPCGNIGDHGQGGEHGTHAPIPTCVSVLQSSASDETI